MLFNSLEFALFVPIVFIIYWLIKPERIKLQNVFILAASYVFYGWWDWRFLILIIISSAVDFIIGLALYKTLAPHRRKYLLWTSIIVNLGMLGFFKYFNFFSENFAKAFTLLGQPIDPITLDLILPVGISFYTFQTLSYTIDIYKGRFKATDDVVAFFAFVSFFPQLVAGPIERARNFLPQFFKERSFQIDKVKDGLRQILWGLVNKVVIADNCAIYVDQIFGNHTAYSGSTLVITAFLFSFQIYCDFSGYSHIAIGTARIFGFNLRQNFRYPFFARDFSDFWTRWHISLTTWFRDYLYIPLRRTKFGGLLKENTAFISFGLIGFWHGPGWNFILWGLSMAFLMIAFKRFQVKKKSKHYRLLPSPMELIQMTYVFILIMLFSILFRVTDIGHVWEICGKIFSYSIFSLPDPFPVKTILFCCAFTIMEWLNRRKAHTLDFSTLTIPLIARWTIYYFLIAMVIYWAAMQKEQAFIYFQF